MRRLLNKFWIDEIDGVLVCCFFRVRKMEGGEFTLAFLLFVIHNELMTLLNVLLFSLIGNLGICEF